MDLAFCSLSSGSSGNCYLVKSETTNILIDVGISRSKIFESLMRLDITHEDLDAVLLTHEHIDHVRSISAVSKTAKNATFYASCGTVCGLGEKTASLLEGRVNNVHSGETFTIGDIEVNTFGISHDAAEPIAYCFKKDGKKIAIVTDTGYVSDEIKSAIQGSDLLVLESNHEENILLYGRYPYSVKRRILSDKGHLSNEAAGRCLCEYLANLEKNIQPKVLLAHISSENNTPQQALLTVKNILEEDDYYVGKDLLLDVILKGVMTDLIPA